MLLLPLSQENYVLEGVQKGTADLLDCCLLWTKEGNLPIWLFSHIRESQAGTLVKEPKCKFGVAFIAYLLIAVCDQNLRSESKNENEPALPPVISISVTIRDKEKF